MWGSSYSGVKANELKPKVHPPIKPEWYIHVWEIVHTGNKWREYAIKKDGELVMGWSEYSQRPHTLMFSDLSEAEDEMYTLITIDIEDYSDRHREGEVIVRWP